MAQRDQRVGRPAVLVDVAAECMAGCSMAERQQKAEQPVELEDVVEAQAAAALA